MSRWVPFTRFGVQIRFGKTARIKRRMIFGRPCCRNQGNESFYPCSSRAGRMDVEKFMTDSQVTKKEPPFPWGIDRNFFDSGK
jgi:hypothetical protein